MKRTLLIPLLLALWACAGFSTSAIPDASSPVDEVATAPTVGVTITPAPTAPHKLGASYPAIPIPANQAEGDLLAYHSGAWNGLAPGTTGQVLTSTGTSSLPSWQASGSAVSVTGSGLWHSTSGTLDSAASKGTAAQIVVTNAGATDTPWVSVSGDATLAASGAITNTKINGTSVNAGGSLTTGQVLRATGAATSTWGAVDLANTSAVTGVLPNTNQANQVLSGDVSGNTGGATVIGIRGTTVPSVTGAGTTVLTDTSGVLSWTAPASLSVTGTGLLHATGGTIDGSAFKGTSGQISITNSGATDTPWVTVSGDCTLSSTGSVTCAKLNGTSFPAGGSLTTGNGPYVSGASAVTYSALNLAGGSGWVTGVLPTANQANQAMGGDVTGTTAASTVAKIQGTAVPAPPGSSTSVLTDTSGTLSWAAPAAGSSVTGTGLWYSASGTLNAAAVGWSGDASFGALSGGNLPVTVAKVNGTSYPAGGSLTTGNSPYVSGSSAVTYQALNLAGGSGWVTGVLPAANMASLAGDVTGPINGNALVAISGSSPIPVTPNVLQWLQGDTAPQWSQAQQANGASPVSWKWSPQAPGASAATTAHGTPGSAIIDLAAPVSTGAEASLTINRGGSFNAGLGPLSGSPTYGVLSLGAPGRTIDSNGTTLELGFSVTSNISLVVAGTTWGQVVGGSGPGRGIALGFPGTVDAAGGDNVITLNPALTVPTTTLSNANNVTFYSNAGSFEILGAGLSFAHSVSAPTIKQTPAATNTTGQNLLISAQDGGSGTSSGGETIIQGGAATGGTTGGVQVRANDLSAFLQVNHNGASLQAGGTGLLASTPTSIFGNSGTVNAAQVVPNGTGTRNTQVGDWDKQAQFCRATGSSATCVALSQYALGTGQSAYVKCIMIGRTAVAGTTTVVGDSFAAETNFLVKNVSGSVTKVGSSVAISAIRDSTFNVATAVDWNNGGTSLGCTGSIVPNTGPSMGSVDVTTTIEVEPFN